jgi:tetratricopeptide (TPR) repeat protein
MEATYQRAAPFLQKALDLDPNSANSHYVKALNATWTDGDWNEGEKEFLLTLDLNPNNALARVYYAHLLMILLRTEEAVQQAEMARTLDPKRPLVLGLYGVVMNYAGNHEAALVQSRKALEIDPGNAFASGPLANAYLGLGDTLMWYETIKTGYWWTSEAYLDSLDQVFQHEGYPGVIWDRIKINEDVLRSGGSISLMGQANRYLEVGEVERAMAYFEKAYQLGAGLLAYISLEVIRHPELRDNARYRELLTKMNLPLKGT